MARYEHYSAVWYLGQRFSPASVCDDGIFRINDSGWSGLLVAAEATVGYVPTLARMQEAGFEGDRQVEPSI